MMGRSVGMWIDVVMLEGGLLWWEELWGGAALGLIHTQPPIYCNMCTFVIVSVPSRLTGAVMYGVNT